jgi:hypothetical protein
MSDLENRVRKLEDDDGRTGDVVITIVHERTYLDENGDRHKVPMTPTDFEEGEWSDLGNGGRMRIRKPRYD